MAEVRIDITSEFKDKGFKKADKATAYMQKQFKDLGRTFLAVFSTRQIIAFGKASVKAFQEDELAARKLTTTLENLNLGFEDPRVKAFISDVERQTGILDDQLRPAMQALLTTTGSVTKAQEMLNMAIEVSRGSGESLTTVASDLSKAYLGNTKGLAKYNLGLHKTELQQKTFAELQVLINKQFSGQNAAYLDTYAGRISVLGVAFANMQEDIGEGLVDSFTILAGKNGIPGAVVAMEDFGNQIANVIRGTAVLISYLEKIPGMGNFKIFDVGNIPVVGAYLKMLENLGKNNKNQPKPFSTPMTISGQTDFYKQLERDRKKADKEALKRQKELIALQKKQLEEQKKRERLAAAERRANTIFDLQNIQVVAALQGQVDGEERLRLTTLLALQTQNYLAAEKLADLVIRLQAPALNNLGVIMQAGDSIDKMIIQMITAQAKLAGLQLLAEDFPIPEDIFQEWEDSLDSVLAKLLEMLALLDQVGKKSPTFADTHMGLTLQQWKGYREDERSSIVNSSATGSAQFTNSGFMPSVTNNSSGMNVVVNVAGNVTTERDLVSAITDQIYMQQKSGQQIVYSSTVI
jgi:hypothetical protein